jgi:transposase
VVNDTIKRKLVQRALMPGASRLTDISRQSGVPYNTLWKWVQKAKLAGVSQQPPKSEPPAQRPDDRTPQDKLRIVLAAAGLPDEELGAFMRREGIHEADLSAWREALEQAALASLGGPGTTSAKERASAQTIRALKAELRRKDKALAETAALLILQKKVLAIWGDEDESTQSENDD